jgi:O-acetyl-ADP-ribose deacetylase (regulator of RNase III)
MIKVLKGNILESNANYILIPVNCCGVAGAGLAKQAKDKWPEWYNSYKNQCEQGHIIPGLSQISYITKEGNNIVSFPTKVYWKFKSHLGFIEDGLKDFLFSLTFKKDERIAIPALGCGLGELKWEDVKKTIVETIPQFKNINYSIWELYEPI